jgi:hypothetical protein
LPAVLEPDTLADQPLVERGRDPVKALKEQIGVLWNFKSIDPTARNIEANRVMILLKVPVACPI